MPQMLKDQPKLDPDWRYLVDWYVEVRGSEQLTFTEIKNWSELACVNLAHWEVNIIKTLDRIYWKQVYDNG